MKPKLVLTVAAAVATLFGLGLLLAPAALLSGFGAQPGEVALVLGRDVGALNLSAGVLFWLARDLPPGPGLRAVLLFGLVSQALEAAVNGVETAMGILGPAAWGGVAVHVVLALGFAWALREARGGR